MPVQTPLQLEGYFLEFASEEMEAINLMLEEEGFEQTPKGLKDYILYLAYEDPDPVKEKPHVDKAGNHMSGILKTLQDNPEAIAHTIAGAGKVFNAVKAGFAKSRAGGA